ncbi:MAG: XRE family transcriptional regulator [Muribaculaceae bacterium]
MHIGQLIRQELDLRQLSPSWLASKIFCSRQHVYNIFHKENLDVELLRRISLAMEHNFFAEIAREVDDAISPVADSK